MKKTFQALVVRTAGLLLGMAAWTVQAQFAPGPFAVPTDGGGTPVYANQEGYYGLSGGCADGKCGNHAVGSIENAMLFNGSAAGGPFVAPTAMVPYGNVCEPYADACAPCEAAPCLPCATGPCLPCLPCLPCFGGCAPCGGGILARIWNGPYYWQGPGCSERVIDELRKSWRTPCPQCDVYGETIARSPNSMGTGLRSAQIVGAGAPYGPIKMDAGQPQNGYYSAPLNQPPTQFQPGGCSSCRKGITVTANQNFPAANPSDAQYAPSVQNVQSFQNVPNVQNPQYVQPVQYVEPTQTAPQASRFSGAMRYRTNYTPSNKTPGYIRAQQNAEKDGIGFDSLPQNGNAQSAWRSTQNQTTQNQSILNQAIQNQLTRNQNQRMAPNQVQVIPVSMSSQNAVVPVDYQQDATQLETIPTPAPRQSDSVLASSPVLDGADAVPTAYPAPYPTMGADCGIPCAEPCGPAPCEPCLGDACLPCGPCLGGGCLGGCWPGLIPLAADTVRFTGCAALRVGRAAVVGTGLALRGSARAVGFVFWNRPLPAPVYGGPVWGGEVVGPAMAIDPVYAQNDFYLNASASDPAGSSMNSSVGLVAENSSARVVPNLYENGYYPQNYSVISDTAVETLPYSGNFQTSQMASNPPVNIPANTQLDAANAVYDSSASAWSGTAALLTAQTQRVFLEDGTEVILEHDAMNTENRALNASVQFASANDSAAPAFHSAIPAGNHVENHAGTHVSAVIPVSVAASTVPASTDLVSALPASTASMTARETVALKPAVLKPAESFVRTASISEEQIISNPSTNAGALEAAGVNGPAAMKRIPVPAGNVSADGYPVVASETPQIQLAPGEVLISQEDFILEPVEENEENANASILIPVNDSREILEAVPENGKETAPVVKPVKDKSVTKVNFVEPIVKKHEMELATQSTTQNAQEKTVKFVKTTDSGWQIIER